MPDTGTAESSDRSLQAVAAAHAAGLITDHSSQMLRAWLTQPRYADFLPALTARIERAAAETSVWKELDDAYWTVIPFGTGGRRGRMYPVGSNAINDRTIGESAQGLADSITASLPPDSAPSCTIAYDTRHRSEHFARLCAEVLLAAGFRIFFLRGFRSTPELSFAVRQTDSTCGIMVTASHNPPSDNAVKVYQSGGVQVLPPRDREIIDCVMRVDEIHREPFEAGVASGRVRFVEEEIDPAFVAAVLHQATPGPRDISILYTPLHGVGASAVVPVLKAAGFQRLRLYAPQAEPDGDFPNVPGHVANPENPAVLAGPMEEARSHGDNLVLASDPDCDRLGAAAPLSTDPESAWKTLTGNQLGALLADWALRCRVERGLARPTDVVVTTLVTSGLIRRIAEHHGVTAIDDLQVGFKWIGETIDRIGPERFVFGCEESHGYLAGTHVRDKDASVAALLLSEQAASLGAEGRTLHERLDELFAMHGCHLERQVAITLPGASGMERMQEIMAGLRAQPPRAIGGGDVVRARDYGSLQVTALDAAPVSFKGHAGDLVIFDLDGLDTAAPPLVGRFPPLGNAVAARPSGTEPKIKFYLFAAAAPCDLAALPSVKQGLNARLERMEEDLRSIVGV
jgi:phosphomannomutase